MTVREKLLALLQTRGWSFYRLAKESGVAWSTIRNMFERGTDPTLSTLEALCTGLDVSLVELLQDDSQTPDAPAELLEAWQKLSEKNQQLALELKRALEEK